MTKGLRNENIVIRATSFDALITRMDECRTTLWEIYGSDDMPTNIGFVISELAGVQGHLEGTREMLSKFGDDLDE